MKGRVKWFYIWFFTLFSVQFSSVTQSCLTLCNPMNHSTPGLPVHHQLLEFTHVHRVSDAIQPSHPLSSPSPPAPNPSQHQGLFQWVNSSHEWLQNFKIIWLFQRIKKEEITFRSICDTIESDTKTRKKILYNMLMHHSFIPRIKRYLKIRKFINVTHHLTIQRRKTIKFFTFGAENILITLNIYLFLK